WIEPPDQIAELSSPPDRAIRRLDRIARALAERRHHPFLECDLDRAGHDLGGAPVVVRWKIGREILEDLLLRLGAAREADHRAGQLLPAGVGVAGALCDHVGLMTPGADRLDRILARTRGQLGTLTLRIGGDRHEHKYCGSKP